MSVFKDFPGLENLEKKFKDFQGPARALCTIRADDVKYTYGQTQSSFCIKPRYIIRNDKTVCILLYWLDIYCLQCLDAVGWV